MIYRDVLQLLVQVDVLDFETGEKTRTTVPSVSLLASVQPISNGDGRTAAGIYRKDTLVAIVPRVSSISPGDVLLYESQKYRVVNVDRFWRHSEVTMERTPDAAA